MNGELFEEFLEKLRGLNELFQKLTHEERWAFLHSAIVMVEGMDKPEAE